MVYLIVKNGVIENSIVCDDEQTASFFGAVPSYIGAKIGDKYKPAGTYGGKGGNSGESNLNGENGTNTQNLDLEFVGTGLGGTTTRTGLSVSDTSGNLHYACSAPGCGGGGYGGVGGSINASVTYDSNRIYSYGGGGGGGYGAKGGNGYRGGGGGGGYGGAGGAGVSQDTQGYSGQGYGAGGGSYGGAGGGGGYGIVPPSTQKNTGNSGVCVVRYSVKEIV